jgi:hypothetical protein
LLDDLPNLDQRAMGVRVVMMTVLVTMRGIVAVHVAAVQDVDVEGGNAGALYAGRTQLVLDTEAAERPAQLLERQTGIEESAQDHVSRSAGETVEVQDPAHADGSAFMIEQ